MNLAKSVVLYIVLAAFPCIALADSNVTFTNADGTFLYSKSLNTMSLTGSTLTGVSNLFAPYNCPPPACTGSVTLTTGALTSGYASLTSGTATFAGGGSFDVTSTGAGGGFTFGGQFSSETWEKHGSGGSVFWTFVGNITNGELKLGNGMDFQNIMAGTIDLTTVGGHAQIQPNGDIKWTNNTGSTNFPSPVPEPSTLALFGGGMIALGFLTRRTLASKSSSVAMRSPVQM
jgi:hypothetical protein